MRQIILGFALLVPIAHAMVIPPTIQFGSANVDALNGSITIQTTFSVQTQANVELGINASIDAPECLPIIGQACDSRLQQQIWMLGGEFTNPFGGPSLLLDTAEYFTLYLDGLTNYEIVPTGPTRNVPAIFEPGVYIMTIALSSLYTGTEPGILTPNMLTVSGVEFSGDITVLNSVTVPEPATLVLCGLAGLWLVRRRMAGPSEAFNRGLLVPQA
jgi:hypothetical protein